MDKVKIDGEKYCGEIGTSTEISTPFSIITNTNNANLIFISDDYNNGLPGFLAIWSQYEIPTGCNNCDFPFTFGDATFDTCISVLGVDTKPWCSYQLSPPTNSGNHIFPPPKISCSDSDSSCPSSSPQTLVTSPNYPLSYSNNADKVK